MPVRPLTIGVDIGGTKVAGGVVDADGTILDRERRSTPGHDPHDTEDTIAEVVTALAGRHEIAAVGIGAAGFVDASRSSVLFAPHLAWRHTPLRAGVERRLTVPVVVENDANAAAWAEWRFGSAVGESHLLCVNLGTGIGGAFITEGEVQRGRFGMAGEYGHLMVVPGGHRCECGNRGCWEQYASGNALVREARELAASGSPVAQQLLERAGGEIAAITGPVVTAAAKDGDATAVELFEEVGRWLGLGLANLAAAYDPGCIVIGGGVSDAGELLLGPAREAFRRSLTGRGFRPEPRIVRSELGNDAGLVGAADLARDARSLLRRARRRMAATRRPTPRPSAERT